MTWPNRNPKNKYGARKAKGLGPTGAPRSYDSCAEEIWSRTLNAMKQAGQIATWVPQVSLECGVDEAGKAVRYRADALLVLELRDDGTFVGRFADRKGMDTEASRAKRAALRSLYGLDTEVIS